MFCTQSVFDAGKEKQLGDCNLKVAFPIPGSSARIHFGDVFSKMKRSIFFLFCFHNCISETLDNKVSTKTKTATEKRSVKLGFLNALCAGSAKPGFFFLLRFPEHFAVFPPPCSPACVNWAVGQLD